MIMSWFKRRRIVKAIYEMKMCQFKLKGNDSSLAIKLTTLKFTLNH